MNWQDIAIILNLFIIESLLSVDNAAVLAVMVRKLPEDQQKKALRYGIIGAYVFRGLCLVLATYLVKILWIKIVGGLYLLWLAYGHFTPEKDTLEEGVDPDKEKSWHGWIRRKVGLFWGTVILVEIMDLVFSVDNVFAAVAMSDKLWVVFTGVAIGILAMRFVAGWFNDLMKKRPNLETSAYIVIALLGFKLTIAGIVDYFPNLTLGGQSVKHILDDHNTDLIFSGLTLIIFFFPLLQRKKQPA